MVKRSVQFCILFIGVVLVSLGAFAETVNAAALGVNYYHESMMTERYKVPYIPLSESQIKEDFKQIKTISNHVKFYMNPLVSVNQDWVLKLTDMARAEGFHVAINIQVDDRKLNAGSWDEYSRKVVEACKAFNGKAQTMLVANELILHSDFSKYEVRSRVEPLINQCKAVFGGEVAYNAFWYEKEAWYDYQKPIHFMHYEGFSNFRTNVLEMNQRWGSNARVGEWGEDLLDGSVEKDDWWQREEIEKRWNVIDKETSAPVAYIFAYREPSWNGFGIVRPDGIKRPLWGLFTSPSAQEPVSEPTPEPQPAPQPTPEPTPEPTPSQPVSGQVPSNILMDLGTSCSVESGNCNVKSDSASGACRNIVFGTPSGDINTYTCAKTDGNAEIYVRDMPQGVTYKVCIGAGCVSSSNGFASFDPYDSYQHNEQNNEQPATSSGTLGNFKVTCQVGEGNCEIKQDSVVGVCRTVEMQTSKGLLVVKACEKSGNVEVYRHVYPSGLNFDVCLGSGCVDQLKGFDKFSLSSSTTTRDPTFGSATATEGVMSVPLYVSPSGKVVNDYKESSGCRRVSAESSSGHVEARICEKESGYEMYRLSSSGSVDLCSGSACVGNTAGFARV